MLARHAGPWVLRQQKGWWIHAAAYLGTQAGAVN